jgi:hypothetical protein
MNEDQIIAQRFLLQNPGTRILGISTILIPAFGLEVAMVVQETKKVPLLEEFILRFIQEGERSPDDILGHLGFAHETSGLDKIAELAARGIIALTDENQVRLTSIGARLASDLEEVRPKSVKQKILFDRAIRQISAVDFSKGHVGDVEALSKDNLVLSVDSKSSVAVADISLDALRELYGEDAMKKVSILRVESIRKLSSRYNIPGKIILYSREASSQLDAHFFIGEKFSLGHQRYLAGNGGVGSLGVTLGAPTHAPEVELVREEQPQFLPQIEVLTALAQPVGDNGGLAALPDYYSIDVFAHYPFMLQALNNAKSRLLLQSPWAKDTIVDPDFMVALEGCLERGVIVTLGLGFSEQESDLSALRRLSQLASKNAAFTFRRHQNSHAKILIYDDLTVVSSFNWLSFRGARDRTYRQEQGTVIRNASYAKSEYERFMDELLAHGHAVNPELGTTPAQRHASGQKKGRAPRKPVCEVGDVRVCSVTRVTESGVLCQLAPGIEGLVRRKDLNGTLKSIQEHFPAGRMIRIRVESISEADKFGRFRYRLKMI